MLLPAIPHFLMLVFALLKTNVLWHDSMGLCDNCAMFVLTTACQADGYAPWEWYYHLSAAKRQGKLVCKGSCGMSADISVTPWCHNRIVNVVFDLDPSGCLLESRSFAGLLVS